MSSVRKTGDWALARRLLAGGPMKLKSAMGTALRQEAQLLRKEIVQGITKQAPGGESFKPLSPLTLAAREMKGRGGTKAPDGQRRPAQRSPPSSRATRPSWACPARRAARTARRSSTSPRSRSSAPDRSSSR